VLRGVSGGVVMGTPVTLPELAAVMLGMLLTISVGLLITPAVAVDVCVRIDDAEFERAGDDGRALTKEAAGGEGAAKEPAESRCRCCAPLGKGDGGANTDVGVGTGVFWLDDTAVSEAACRLEAGVSPV